MSKDQPSTPPEVLEINQARNLLVDLKKHILNGKTSQDLHISKFTSMISSLRRNMNYLNDGLVLPGDTNATTLGSREQVKEHLDATDKTAMEQQVQKAYYEHLCKNEDNLRKEYPQTHADITTQLGLEDVVVANVNDVNEKHELILNVMKTEKVEREVLTDKQNVLKRRRDELVELVDSSRAALQRGKVVVTNVMKVLQDSEHSLSSSGLSLQRRGREEQKQSEELQQVWKNTLIFSKVVANPQKVISWNGFELPLEANMVQISLDMLSLTCVQVVHGPVFVNVKNIPGMDLKDILSLLQAESGWSQVSNSLGLVGEEPKDICLIGYFIPGLLQTDIMQELRHVQLRICSTLLVTNSVGTVRLQEYLQETSDWSVDMVKKNVFLSKSTDDLIALETYLSQRKECVVEENELITVRCVDQEVNSCRYEVSSEGTVILDVTMPRVYGTADTMGEDGIQVHHSTTLLPKVPTGVYSQPGVNIFAEWIIASRIIKM